MAITTTSVLSAPIQQTLSLRMLSVPTPKLIHHLAAMHDTMPRHGGRIKRFRRYNRLDTALVPLGNSGVTPPAQELTAQDIDLTINFYGTYIILNEQVELQAQDPVLNEAAMRLGESLRNTNDELIRNMLVSTATLIPATGGLNGDSPTDLARSDVDGVVRALENNDAYTILDQIEGEDKFGTGPIRDAYYAFASTRLIGSLEEVDGFLHKSQYPSQQNVKRSEWGSIGNLRFFLSSAGAVRPSASNNGEDVFDIICCGAESYAVVEQDGYSAQMIVLPPEFSGPLAQNYSAGFKFAQAIGILQNLWVMRLAVTL